jgi:neurofibromin 1
VRSAYTASLLLHCVGTNGLKVSDTFTVLLEQSIAVLRLTVDRVQPGSHLDVSEIMLYFARYLSRLGRDDAALRLKMRYCHLAEMVMSKEETVSAGHDSIHKNSLLDWLTEWSLDSMKVSTLGSGGGMTDAQDVDAYSSSHITRSKTQKDLDHACLRTLAVATKGLVLRSTTEPSEETPTGVRARLFQKYFTMLIRALERAATPDVCVSSPATL